jgi:hypothetical protein
MENERCAYVLVKGKKKGTRCDKGATKTIGDKHFCLTHYRLSYPMMSLHDKGTVGERVPEPEQVEKEPGKVHFEERELELDDKRKRKYSDSESDEDEEDFVEDKGKVHRQRTPQFGQHTANYFELLEKNCLDAIHNSWRYNK